MKKILLLMLLIPLFSTHLKADLGSCLVFPSDLVILDSNEVSKMVFWSVEYSKRYWLTSGLIYGSAGMLDTISHQKYWNHLVFSTSNWEKDTIVFQEFGFIDGPFGGYAIYNYNSQINIAELKRLVYLKFNFNFEDITTEFKRKHKMTEDQEWTPKLQEQYEKAISQKLQSLYDWFWRKGILVVAINGTC